MTEVSLTATLRSAQGKGAARRLRRDGLVPAVVYAGGKDAVAISVTPKDLTKALMTPHRRNALIQLEIEGQGKRAVMLRDLQKDPLKRGPTHADFLEIDTSAPVTVNVPFFAVGRSKTVIAGGKIEVPLRSLRVRVLPSKIPAQIELDTTDLEFGAHRAKDVPMPEGVELLDDPMLTVVTISRARGGVAAEGEEEAAAS